MVGFTLWCPPSSHDQLLWAKGGNPWQVGAVWGDSTVVLVAKRRTGNWGGSVARGTEVVRPVVEAPLLGIEREYWCGDRVVLGMPSIVYLSALGNLVIRLGNIFLARKGNMFEFNPKFICLCKLLKRSVGLRPNMREVRMERMSPFHLPSPPLYGGGRRGFHYFPWWGLYL
jgi:hypothetical protein